jgi:hypothetical protein
MTKKPSSHTPDAKAAKQARPGPGATPEPPKAGGRALNFGEAEWASLAAAIATVEAIPAEVILDRSGLGACLGPPPLRPDPGGEGPVPAGVACGSSPTKGRRTKGAIRAIKAALHDTLAAEHPMTVRQVFYRMVSRGAIAKTEGEYKRTVVRLLGQMRWDGEIPFGWIADNTRWMRKPQTDSSVEAALRRVAESYRRSLWDDQPVYVEIWLEKDALAGVLYPETDSWDVPLMVTRGYPSLSYLNEAAEVIEAQGKPAYLYYFGDYDPSGLDIPRKVEEGIRKRAPGADIHFERVAVTAEQIEAWALPTRPTKRNDSRSKGFQGESVEVDAIPAGTLRSLVKDCIVRHVDQRALEVQRVAEESERELLEMMAAKVARAKR